MAVYYTLKNIIMKNTKRIYTNGKSLFTLENFDKATSICYPHNITFHSEVSLLKARAMHEKGLLHYISGMGDRKVLAGIYINRKMKLKNFKIS